MRQVVVSRFGGVDSLELVELPTPEPGPGQVRVRLTSIGMNHADLMARRGAYKISSGEPPFIPGIEGGGVIEALGPGVSERRVGQRVSVSADAPRPALGLGGTYRTHYLCPADRTVPVPDAVPDDQLGALWLSYLTAWGCLVWKENLHRGQHVALPAASSSVALAAAQVARGRGAVTIGLTTSEAKAARIRALPTAAYDHLVVTHDGGPGAAMRPWHQELKKITTGNGVDLFFDPVASGEYLNTEIRSLAQFGTVWVYGLLGRPGVADVTPLIRKYASIRGWALNELIAAGPAACEPGYRHILEGFASGQYRQHVDRVFGLDNVRAAHEHMEQGKHVGKLVLVP